MTEDAEDARQFACEFFRPVEQGGNFVAGAAFKMQAVDFDPVFDSLRSDDRFQGCFFREGAEGTAVFFTNF